MRSRLARTGAQEPEFGIAGSHFLSFCSNDYLGLANHPQVRHAFKLAVDRYGLGSGGSHMVTGHCVAHQALEEELADFMGRDRALLFSTGYMANTGIINALTDTGGLILQDSLNHASLLDGGWLSKAESCRYPHNDCAALNEMLSKSTASHHLIVSDGVFSMDGDLAPLPELIETARRYGAWLMIDDAHGIGCLGASGRGIAEAFAFGGCTATQSELPVLVGTLGKAFGSSGAFVVGDSEMIEYLIQFTRPYIYSTAMPPAVAEATRTSLRLLREEPWRRQRVQDLVIRFRERVAGLPLQLTDSTSPIQAIILGDVETAMRASMTLAQEGLHVSAIRPPTVPVGTSRLRITFSAAHTDAHLDRLISALERVSADVSSETQNLLRYRN
ncbi:MAG: 8-amino-7-oxononanoate synthase [Gammaproteobacteria bacterium]|nr:8-amino-7-oxononanoate synthase [Gammaproteobacteria bacterium]MDP2347696.1 8-amino-7-oxononanoate synthase [Gammaproteobacteria bacterium]